MSELAIRCPVAVIGGTGMNQWPGLEVADSVFVDTPYGAPSAPLLLGKVHGTSALFLARHGQGHKLPPHRINYRANLWALKQAGVQSVVAIAAVGGIAHWFAPGTVAIADDLIDYTWGREHTYSDGMPGAPFDHVEMTEPYSARVRRELIEASRASGVEATEHGVMGVTQGPRLETPAEIRRMQSDGCDMVGMTGMPEAALARELGLDYACLAVSVNWGAGLGNGGGIHDEIAASLEQGMTRVRAILTQALPVLSATA